MPTNIANIIAGPALIQFRGASIYSKGDIILNTSLETFTIEVDRYREVDERLKQTTIGLRFTPAGEWENLGVLYPYASTLLGDFITPVRTVASVDATANTITLDRSLPVGSAVRLSSDTTLPAGTDASTLYYLGGGTLNAYTLHSTYALAIAGTSPVDITDVGTGTHKVAGQEPLVIHSFDGRKLTFHNAAIVQMPGINGSAVETLLEEVGFECFPKVNTAWSTANSWYTETAAALTDTTFDPAAIITQPYTMAWGSSPWASFATKAGVKVGFALQLEAVETDADGILTRKLAGLKVTARAQPMGISTAQLLSALAIQGATAVRGRSLSGSDLNISATGVYVRLYGAALKGGPQQFSSKLDRIGELEWVATRTFSAGAPNDLFFVGTAAPA